MKIGFFVNEVSVPAGYEKTISAHVQIPLHSIKLLQAAGHDMHLITTTIAPGEVLPFCMPSGVAVHEVVDPRVKQNGRSHVRTLSLFQHLRQIKRIVLREKFDLVHFHGSRKLPDIAVMLRLMGVRTPFVATVNDSEIPARYWFIRGFLWNRIVTVLTSTSYVRDLLVRVGVHATLLRHGGVRDLRAELGNRHVGTPSRVLFWRDPSSANGADICIETFRELAPKFPQVSFVAAVRDGHWENWVVRFAELASHYPNINLYQFPYPDEISLAQLLAEAICVLLPFRKLSYHPQLSVLESIAFGSTVITTSLESNIELADNGNSAVLIPVGNVSAAVSAVNSVLTAPEQARTHAELGRRRMETVWNWDDYVPRLTAIYATVRERTGVTAR